jgi:hypothetical protein
LVKSTGDGHLTTFDGPTQAIRCAEAVRADADTLGIEIRAGIHTGECELLDRDIGGIAVHIAARILDQAGAGEILVSRTVRDLVVGSGTGFEDRGSAELRGVPGTWQLLATVRVTSATDRTSRSIAVTTVVAGAGVVEHRSKPRARRFRRSREFVGEHSIGADIAGVREWEWMTALTSRPRLNPIRELKPAECPLPQQESFVRFDPFALCTQRIADPT